VAGGNFDPNRLVARQRFLANVIVTEVETGNHIPGLIRNLSPFGCYVETTAPFSPGVTVRLIISHSGEKVRALGKVAHATANKGMGIALTSILPDDQTILEAWMGRRREH
jgi:hypothetical protein